MSSRFAFIIVAIGAAIGLGNIWKFPYMVGIHGGSAFVLSYLVCLAMIGIPAMVAEIVIGKSARLDPINSFKYLAEQSNSSSLWKYAGLLGVITSIVAFSFYSVIAGWTFGYGILSIKGVFSSVNNIEINNIWESFLSNSPQIIVFHTIFIIATVSVNALGVKNGIERISKFILPLLFITLLALVIYSSINGNFEKTLDFMFNFRANELSAEALLSAMGHAFFTLAVGACAMLIYGSYMPKSASIFPTVATISIIDTIVALLAGLAIYPIVFKNDLPIDGGPGLMFQTLPIAFGKMKGGNIVGLLFFLLLFLAAWSTAIAMVEPVLACIKEKFSVSRKQAAIYIGIFAWTLGLGSILSFSTWQNFKLFNKWTIFDALTEVTSNILLPLGGLSVALFVGWVMHKSIIKQNFTGNNTKIFNFWYYLTKFVTPLCICIIMLSTFI